MTAFTQAAVRILLAAVILMIPCLVSGRPQLFSDTKSYYYLGQEIASLSGIAPSAVSELSTGTGQAGTPTIRPVATHAAAASIRDERLAYTVAGSRSPIYSVYLYLLASVGTAWLVVAVQCLLTALVLWIALHAFALDRRLVAITLVLAMASSLAIFTFFVMPDFIMALGVLSLAVLAARWEEIARGERVVLAAVIGAAALFHGANAVVLFLVASGGLIASIVFPALLARLRPGLAVTAALAVAGLISLMTYPLAVRELRHETVYSPPFLAARLIADGPGRAYLRDRCGTGITTPWCGFAKQPLADNNDILWNTSPKRGAFQLADYSLRVKLIQDQSSFVLAVLRYDPGYVVRTAAANVTSLFFNFRVQEVLEEDRPTWTDPRFHLFATLVPGMQDCARSERACAPRLNYRTLNLIFGSVALVSALVVGVLLGNARLRARWGSSVLLIVVTLVVNACIYGVISGNAERYQSRLMWLVPFLALCLLYSRRATPGENDGVAGTGSGRTLRS